MAHRRSSSPEVAGLGTQLIRMLSRQLNGTVSVERAAGTYAVHVAFPLQSAVSWRHLVLIVEDQMLIAWHLNDLIEGAGHRVLAIARDPA